MKSAVPRTAMLVVALLQAASPAHAQHLAGGASPDVSIVRIVAALAISLLAAAALVLKQRRFPMHKGPRQMLAALADGFARERRIDVIEARRISVHADVCLVRCDAEEFLILSSSAGSTVLRSGPASTPSPPDLPGEGLPQ